MSIGCGDASLCARIRPYAYAGAIVFLTIASVWGGGTIHPAVLWREAQQQSASPAGSGLFGRQAVQATGIPCFVRSNDPDALRGLGVLVGASTGGLVAARVPPGRVRELAALPGVQAVYPSGRNELHNDVGTAGTSGGGNYLGINSDELNDFAHRGRGVIVGIVDSGIDWRHKDFIWDEDESSRRPVSRILYLWDQTLSRVDLEQEPADFGYGVEYTRADIGGALALPPTATVRATDSDGHGTHVAGTAAGDGSDTDGDPSAGKYRGVAPHADLIVVNAGPNLEDVDILNACNYIFSRADALQRPCVINLSLGSHSGSHDGRHSASLSGMLSNLVGPGRLICASAGNERDQAQHAEITIAASGTANLTYQQAANRQRMIVELWHHRDDAYAVSVTIPTVGTTAPVPSGTTAAESLDGHAVTVFNADGPTMTQDDGDKSIQIEVFRTFLLKTGTWSINLERTSSGGSGAIDAWFQLTIWGGTWDAAVNTEEELVGSPANGDRIVAVAAHVTKNSWTSADGDCISCCTGELPGQIAPFSSPGPLRRESASVENLTQTPDVSAPGRAIASSLSSAAAIDTPERIVDDERHSIRWGTSMACPYVVGTLALALEMDPTLTVERVRDQWRICGGIDASSPTLQDSLTGPVPNDDFGYGKINAAGTLAPFLPTAVRSWPLYE